MANIDVTVDLGELRVSMSADARDWSPDVADDMVRRVTTGLVSVLHVCKNEDMLDLIPSLPLLDDEEDDD